MEKVFSHIAEDGTVTMVNMNEKTPSHRIAIAESIVYFNEKTFHMLEENALPKGDVLTTAKIAGIMAAKQSSTLIPMCHPLALTYIDIRFTKLSSSYSLVLESEVHTYGVTGVEIEALVAVQIASITVYDMCKAVQKDIQIGDCKLLYKSGGKSGEYRYSR
ncbi:MAG: cyclic pyranopterin monophosphate synthase MoaC [Desulfovibrionaceae bacterium]|nr:cyclic pyranopterin monophosphate synthase MoaC [Desulfovibrionaceae bacterium]